MRRLSVWERNATEFVQRTRAFPLRRPFGPRTLAKRSAVGKKGSELASWNGRARKLITHEQRRGYRRHRGDLKEGRDEISERKGKKERKERLTVEEVDVGSS